MELKKGQKVYFTGKEEAFEGVVAEDFVGEWGDFRSAVLLFVKAFGEEVYIQPDQIYFSKKSAEERLLLNTALVNLRHHDISLELVKQTTEDT